jgi:hypothetical protein
MIDKYLVDTCEVYQTAFDVYGDHVTTTHTDVPCRFRYITSIRRGSNEETNDTDAMIWFSANQNVARGTVLKYDGYFYKIERMTKAMRLGQTKVQFLKCDLKAISIGIS